MQAKVLYTQNYKFFAKSIFTHDTITQVQQDRQDVQDRYHMPHGQLNVHTKQATQTKQWANQAESSQRGNPFYPVHLVNLPSKP